MLTTMKEDEFNWTTGGSSVRHLPGWGQVVASVHSGKTNTQANRVQLKPARLIMSGSFIRAVLAPS